MESAARSKYTLSIDIGNTRAHFGVIDNESMECILTRFISSEFFCDKLVSTVLDITGLYNSSYSMQIVISSVIKKYADFAYLKLDEIFTDCVKIAGFSSRLPFQCIYRNPQRIGTDRLANVLYGYSRIGNKKCILISAGTAVTIDILKDGVFYGGTIMPGVKTQFESLDKSTDALPGIDIKNLTGEIKVPGMSTEECISAGVVYGVAGAVERIVDESKNITGKDCTVLATGGDWSLISKFVKFDYQSIPDMTLIGTALFVNYI